MAIDPQKRIFQPIDNYIYLYHLNALVILPGFPDNVTDSTGVSFSTSTSLGRSAPIYSYTGSGPRSMQIDLNIHREALNLMNYNIKNSQLAQYFTPDEDYTDVIIRLLQAAALPTYAASEKMVDPPLVACRFGDDIYIKGVINGNVGISYEPPVLRNGKLAKVSISFQVQEVDAYDAAMIAQIGSYRNPGDIVLNTNLDSEMYYSGAGKSLRYGSGGSRGNNFARVNVAQ